MRRATDCMVQSKVFEGVTADDAKELAELCELRQFSRGTLLVKQVRVCACVCMCVCV
jgi:hypothetical protein